MDSENEITVVSSYATDVLMHPDGTIINTVEGGPARFIADALKAAKARFVLHQGERLTVEIEVRGDGEYGRIPSPSLYRKLSEVSTTRYSLVSTLLDEWKLDTSASGRLMVDIQGYVRDGSAFGRKQAWPFDAEFTKQIYCIKGTEEEVSYIPDDLVQDQKAQRMLVVTRGKEGATVYEKGQEFIIPAQVVEGLSDTVGVGDTFFAYYVASFSETENAQSAGWYAAQKTAEFLARKK